MMTFKTAAARLLAMWALIFVFNWINMFHIILSILAPIALYF